jgi:thiol-disulfide isomerase/thioredoxin
MQAAETVFDGSLFFSYEGNSRYMVMRQGNPHRSAGESSQNPLVAPFMFLTKQSDSCLDCMLRFTDITSDSVGVGLTLPPGEISDGLRQISITGQMRARTGWAISIDDADGAFTPKVITMIDLGYKVQMVNRLLNYTNLGGYQFPSRVEWSLSSYLPPSPSTLLDTGTVQLISARLLERVSDSVFRLDDKLASAETIWDATQEKFIKQGSPIPLQMNSFVRSQPKIYDESADGAKLMADALDRANQEGKHVLIEFGANWCSGCHTLRLLLETNQSVSAELRKNYVVVMIDVNKGHNQDIVEKYGPTLFGLPTIAVSDMKGRKLTTQNVAELETGEEYSPDKVMTFLKKWSPQK